MYTAVLIYGRIFMRQNGYLSFSSRRVRGTMPPSMWTQHWLFRMQRYCQMPVISDMPALHLSWTSECFSGQQSPGQQRVGGMIACGGVVFKQKQLGVLQFCLHCWALLFQRVMRAGLGLSCFWYVKVWGYGGEGQQRIGKRPQEYCWLLQLLQEGWKGWR